MLTKNVLTPKTCVDLEKIQRRFVIIVLEPFMQIMIACLLTSILASTCKAQKVALEGYLC